MYLISHAQGVNRQPLRYQITALETKNFQMIRSVSMDISIRTTQLNSARMDKTVDKYQSVRVFMTALTIRSGAVASGRKLYKSQAASSESKFGADEPQRSLPLLFRHKFAHVVAPGVARLGSPIHTIASQSEILGPLS